MRDRNDELEAKAVVEKVCPAPLIRRASLLILADAIKEANTYGRSVWAVRVEDTVRLTVGHYYVCTIVEMGVWLALDDCFRNSEDYYPTLDKLKIWGWQPDELEQANAYPRYKDKTRKKDFSLNGYYAVGPDHQEAWPHIRRLFFDFIYKAVFYGQPMVAGTPGLHSPGLLKYIRNELGIDIPDPLHQLKASS